MDRSKDPVMMFFEENQLLRKSTLEIIGSLLATLAKSSF
jgi:hypothetical protein